MLSLHMKRIAVAVAITLTGSAMATELAREDQGFLATAAHSGMLEIQASELALEKAQSEEVRNYAKMMMEDHSKVEKELQTLASEHQFALPTMLDEDGQEKIQELEQQTGLDFDEQYAQDIAVEAHEEAVAAFETAAERAHDDRIKAFATRTLPSLLKHLEEGKTLEEVVNNLQDGKPGALGGDTPAERTEPPQKDRRY